MIIEKNYDFRQRIADAIHLKDRRDYSVQPNENEIEITSEWVIVAPKDQFNGLFKRMVLDIQDYFLTSMGISLQIVEEEQPKSISFEIDAELSDGVRRIYVEDEKIVIVATSDRELFRTAIYMEDLMNLAEAPILEKGTINRLKRIRMNSTHSGAGIDYYPDWQLNAILHAGFTAIELFVKDFNHNNIGYCDINDLIDRAESYGLDVIIYNYMRSYKHPSDSDADAFFDSIYGEIFRRYPKAAGISLVGESLQFPSKDPLTTGKTHRESVIDGIPDTRPFPGWWPCVDYPDYITKIVNAVHNVKPEAEVILNTYNWGYTDKALRRELLSKLPKCVTVQTTYEIFKINHRSNLSCPVMDYSISAAEPGEYFLTEAQIASDLGMRLRATTNTAGTTWDFGTVPYVPVPQRWIRKIKHLNFARDNWGLKSHYADHHYGWVPNVVVDLCRFNDSEPNEVNFDELLYKIAKRDYGIEAADAVVEAWQLWSDAMDFYVASNEDQYGPWRVGPAYPLIFRPNITRTMGSREIQFPTNPDAHFGYHIVKTLYEPYENENQSPGVLRYPIDIEDLTRMHEIWLEGLKLIEGVMDLVPAKKKDNIDKLYSLGLFILNSVTTTINTKKWWQLNMKLFVATSREEIETILTALEELIEVERANVLATIPAVENDSRIGWEPSMEYVCDKWHLEWKIRHLNHTLTEIANFRNMTNLC